MVLFGTRPEAIKLAPVVNALRQRAGHASTTVVVTGQHREMLDQVLDAYGLVPDADLDLHRSASQPVPSLPELVSLAVTAIDKALVEHQPRVLVVQGDTTTAFAGALAGFLRRVPVAHVEAGLRTHDLDDPFPEEGNRRLISALARVHFAPTATARNNLLAEGIDAGAIHLTGNTVVDALRAIDTSNPATVARLPEQLRPLLESAGAPGAGTRLILATLHRRENWGAPIASVCRALRDVVDELADVALAFPLHKNPIVRDVVTPLLDGHPRIALVEPLEYTSLLYALRRCHLVVTDSGGIQEEAPAFGKPVLVARETTERPEGVEAGVARLVGTRYENVRGALRELLLDPAAYQRMAKTANPYGDGLASSRIADILLGT